MNLQAWHGALRDLRTDWHEWNRGERIAAALVVAAAGCAVGTLLVLSV